MFSEVTNKHIWLDTDTPKLARVYVGESNQLDTNGHQLNVDQWTTLGNASSVVVDPTDNGRPGLDTGTLALGGPSSSLNLQNGHVRVREFLAGTGGLIFGNGTVEIGSEDGGGSFGYQGTVRVAPTTGGDRTLTIKAAEGQIMQIGNEIDPVSSLVVDGLLPGDVNRLKLVIEGKRRVSFAVNLRSVRQIRRSSRIRGKAFSRLSR